MGIYQCFIGRKRTSREHENYPSYFETGHFLYFQMFVTLILITNQVVDLPACLLHLPDLHFLSLTGNRIHRLPNTLERLESSLQGLYLAQNCLAHLPPCLAKCLLLKELYLDHNPVTHLPANLTSLPNLAILSITHTLVSSLPALPSPSCLRIQAEHCPNLLSVPYLTGN